jgi:putative hydrolase of the HAD superfamily
MAIKLITFDLDNTLWHTDPVIVRADKVQWQSIITRCPEANTLFTPKSFNQLKLDVIQKNPKLRHKLSTLRQEILFQLFIQCGLDTNRAKLFSQQVFAEFLQARNQVELFPGAVAMLKILQPDFKIIALSNGNANLKDIGIDHFFDAHFHAENVPQPKPHKDMFIAALEHTRASAEECIHIGDHPEQDIYAAKQLGIKTVWANVLRDVWPTESLPLADHEINHLDQLSVLIKDYK